VALSLRQIVPAEKSVQPMADVMPPPEPQSSSSLRPCLSLVNEIRRCTRVQGSTVRTQSSKAQGEAARSVVDTGFFRQTVGRSGDAIHRPAAPAMNPKTTENTGIENGTPDVEIVA
jgi:hypothetical protein